MFVFRVVSPPLTEKKYVHCIKQAIIINLIIWSHWCKERFIVYFTFQ